MVKEELSKATPVEAPKQTKKPPSPALKGIRYFSVAVIIIGIAMLFSGGGDVFNYMGIYVIVFGVGLFVATKIRVVMWGMPFILVLLGTLCYQTLPLYYQEKGYNSTAQADVKNAHTAAMAYFDDYPNSSVSLSKLTSYGLVISDNVTLTILSGNRSDLKISSVHKDGNKIYSVDSDGTIR